ncbi:MAG: hypothetical protein Q9191_005538 [Dirinaria sp. TL-2023a]
MGNTATRPISAKEPPAEADNKNEQVPAPEPPQNLSERDLRVTVADDDEDDAAASPPEQVISFDEELSRVLDSLSLSKDISSDNQEILDNAGLRKPEPSNHKPIRAFKPVTPSDTKENQSPHRIPFPRRNWYTPGTTENPERRYVLPRLQQNAEKAKATASHRTKWPMPAPGRAYGADEGDSKKTRMDLPPRRPDETWDRFIARVKEVYLQDPHPRYTNVPIQRPGETTQQWIDRVVKLYTQDRDHGSTGTEKRVEVPVNGANQASGTGIDKKRAQTLIDEATERFKYLDTAFGQRTSTTPKTEVTASMERLVAGTPPMKRPHHQFAFWESCTADNVDANLAARLKDPAHIKVGLMDLMQEERNSDTSNSKRVKSGPTPKPRRKPGPVRGLGIFDPKTKLGLTVANSQPLSAPRDLGDGGREVAEETSEVKEVTANENKAKGGSTETKDDKAKKSKTKEVTAGEGKTKNDKARKSKKSKAQEGTAKQAEVKGGATGDGKPKDDLAKKSKAQEDTIKTSLGKGTTDKLVPHEPTSSQKQFQCPLLEYLPVEIRLLIYKHLLVADKVIRGGELVQDKLISLIIPDQRPPMLDLGIDSTILRTCRQIYREALPILYKDNTFGFSQVKMIKAFKKEGLVPARKWIMKSISEFNFTPTPQGRLSLVRKLHLRFTGQPRPATGHGQSRSYYEPNQWAKFLQESRYEEKAKYTYFPSLTHLTLDFSEWKMTKHEGVALRPFVEKFKVPHGLQSLTLFGFYHMGSSDALKEGLVAKDGQMRLYRKDCPLPTF